MAAPVWRSHLRRGADALDRGVYATIIEGVVNQYMLAIEDEASMLVDSAQPALAAGIVGNRQYDRACPSAPPNIGGDADAVIGGTSEGRIQ